MLVPPTSRRQLFTAPLTGAAFGFLSGVACMALVGGQAAMVIGAVVGAAFAAAMAWAAWRSDFGPRQWCMSAVIMAGCLAVAMHAAGSLVAIFTNDLGLGRRLALVGSSGLLLTAVVAAVFQARQRDGIAAWKAAVIDESAGRVLSPFDAGLTSHRPRAGWIPTLAGSGGICIVLWGRDLPLWAMALPAVCGGAALYGAWYGLGSLITRTRVALAAEVRVGRNFAHHNIDRLNAWRRGETPKGAFEGPKDTWPVRIVRWVRGVLLVIMAFGPIALLVIGVYEALPTWVQVYRWHEFRHAQLVVLQVGLPSKSADWTGRGVVNGEPISFRARELEAVLGRPKGSRQDELDRVHALLPLHSDILWNPNAWRRILAQDSTYPKIVDKAWFATSFVSVFGLASFVAWVLDRLLKHYGNVLTARAQALARRAKRQAVRARLRRPQARTRHLKRKR
jgi:hypothetical protein